MTTHRETDRLLVVRAWRHPDGPLCARVGALTDPAALPCWELCVGQAGTLVVVQGWLQRWSLDAPVTSHR